MVMRVFALTLSLLLVWLLYTLMWGKNGVMDFRSVQAEIEVQQQVNANLHLRNQEMFAEIDDLRQGLDAIEERARNELGMVKDGETFYRIIGEESRQ
ncbi:cell division protein FtsB [Vibrio cholerae]|nr:cell division protein FtsB [Vibrio cholerae]